MRRFDTALHERIAGALKRNPTLSNRAIAKLIDAAPKTVARVRALNGSDGTSRTELNGRKARGRKPTFQFYEEHLADDVFTVYRVYHLNELLYVGHSLHFLQRLATYKLRQTWWRDITHVTLNHFTSEYDARNAEKLAIRTERPKYNIQGKPTGRLMEALLRASDKSSMHTTHARPYTGPGPRSASTAPSSTNGRGSSSNDDNPHNPGPGMIKRPTGRVKV